MFYTLYYKTNNNMDIIIFVNYCNCQIKEQSCVDIYYGNLQYIIFLQISVNKIGFCSLNLSANIKNFEYRNLLLISFIYKIINYGDKGTSYHPILRSNNEYLCLKSVFVHWRH